MKSLDELSLVFIFSDFFKHVLSPDLGSIAVMVLTSSVISIIITITYNYYKDTFYNYRIILLALNYN